MTAARETIFALSSGAPPAAIAVVRISGAAAGAALEMLAGRLPPPRRATVATLRTPDGEMLDRALVLWFPAPASATGEELVELHLHGGRAVVAALLAALAARPDCRPARPGEFTRRAFANGRIDLLQAEGLADLLAAETEGARRQALRAAEGGLSRCVERWRERLLVLAARAEAVLEFGADDSDIAPDPGLRSDIDALAEELVRSLATPPAERLRDGIRVVVAGPPNAGKSTLVNALAGRDVALATPVPGTTRDLIEAPVVLDGVALVLTDSAGLRDSGDPVERLGVERALAAIASADLTIWLGQPDEAPSRETMLVVHPRSDLAGRTHPMPGAEVAVSAVTGTGMDALRGLILARAREMLPSSSLAWSIEQRAWIDQTYCALRDASSATEEIVLAEELQMAIGALDGLSGRRQVEKVLDRLFQRFCVGK